MRMPGLESDCAERHVLVEDVRPLRCWSEACFRSTVRRARISGPCRVDRSWNALVHDGSGDDLVGNSTLTSPIGRALTKGLSEEPAKMRLIRKAHFQGDFA